MQAVVLERAKHITVRDIPLDDRLGPHDVRIKIHTVGICGSDVHYYQHGRIGPFVVESPMVLGHEAAGTIVEVGPEVRHLAVGDRVCMEPGIPDPNSRASRLGIYNLDPAVRFWATPPIHGCLRPLVVHPAAYTFKVPDNITFAEAAMVEPLAVGLHAATKARIKPGDVGVVLGAGPIGMVTALAAIAGGCSRVIITDIQQAKLDLAARLGPIQTVNVGNQSVQDAIEKATDGWGADVVFEATGNTRAASSAVDLLCPGGCLVFIGMPPEAIPFNVVSGMIREARIEHVFRYAHMYPRALALMASGKINVKPLITDTFPFADSVRAFDFASDMPASSVKAQIQID